MDGDVDPERVFRLGYGVLFLWHAHRTALIFCAGAFCAGFFLVTRWQSIRTQCAKISASSTPAAHKAQARHGSLPSASQGYSIDAKSEAIAASNQGPKRVTGRAGASRRRGVPTALQPVQPHIFFFSLGGSTRAYAEWLSEELSSSAAGNVLFPVLHDLTETECDDYFTTPPALSVSASAFYLLLLPSYNIDTELAPFLTFLEETHHDFRIDTAPLRKIAGYSVFGFGDAEGWPSEKEGFCSQAIEADKWMSRLTGGKRAFPLGTGNVKEATEQSTTQQRLEEWTSGVREIMMSLGRGAGLGEGVYGSGEAVESGDDDGASDADERRAGGRASKSRPNGHNDGEDLEDLGSKRAPIAIDFTTTSEKGPAQILSPKPMVPESSPTYQALTKQGYTIVGSHSGVKICRWTKSALRGRGSCYKYSFYGINSHLCMEATPSLSCSNKCVFCWRHGTNPVGTTWRWSVDPPAMVFNGIKAGHYKKIKMMRGVPGVRAERFAEAMRIGHCALSLVGEPIFYPHINELLSMLHREHISSFLVCNAQHPDQLEALGHVTQLYVSIDASNAESLKKIDRPLHRDYWQRFIRCMDIIRAKRFMQRTVFRLTLVKGFNIEEEAEGYAALVERALPAFVEVKGVTYCGTSTSKGAGLSMQNVPFYEEVTAFVLTLEAALQRRGLNYGIAAEHAHSCCILLADKTRFFLPRRDNGELAWHSLIDYTAFFRCLEAGNEFGPEDYIGDPTAEWALWGNGGFDPRDERVDRKGTPKALEAT